MGLPSAQKSARGRVVLRTMPTPATVICVTPVRNEAWVLERFLEAASVWADRIVIADQGSEDGSREIAGRYAKVTLVDNPNPAYDEAGRQRLLIDEARTTPGRRLVVALDADEALSSNAWLHGEWEDLRHAPEGTVGRFEWVNLLPGLRRCWVPGHRIPFAFLDDGSSHVGEPIHSIRIPVRPTGPIKELEHIKVLHFQHVDWLRMKSKQRWYQCWEALHHPTKRPLQIYRQYHRMDAFPSAEVRLVEPGWIDGIDEAWPAGREETAPRAFHWDREVVDWLIEHGSGPFRRLDIWDVDWRAVAVHFGRDGSAAGLRDPRSPSERAVLRWLRRTQPHAERRRTRLVQRAFIPFGW